MIRNTKRIVAILLAVILLFSVSSFAETSEEPVKIKWITVGTKLETSAYEAVWAQLNEWFIRDLNCTLEIEYIGWSDMKGQLALRYAAGTDDFDFTTMSRGKGYADLVAKNALVELTDEMMETYMPNTWEQVPVDFWNQCRINGKLYMVPFNSPRYNAHSITLRGDIREKYGYDEFTSFEEFTEFLKEVGANEPGMWAFVPGGDDFLFYLCQTGKYWSEIGFCGIYFEIGANTVDSIRGSYFTEEYMEYAKWIRELAEAGCWPEDAINTESTSTGLFDAGAAVAIPTNLTSGEMRGITAVTNGYESWKVEQYDFEPDTPKSVSSCLLNAVSFNRNSSHIELALQVCDKLYADREYNELLMLGFEGKNWLPAGDGFYIDLDSTLPEDEQYKGAWYATWNFVNQAVERTESNHYGSYCDILAKYDAAMVVSKLDSFVFDNSKFITETATVNDIIQKYQSSIGLGMYEDPEAAVEQFRAELLAAGYDKLLDEIYAQAEVFLENY